MSPNNYYIEEDEEANSHLDTSEHTYENQKKMNSKYKSAGYGTAGRGGNRIPKNNTKGLYNDRGGRMKDKGYYQ